MKKATKITALLLTIAILMSSMTIVTGAINSKSSAKELLNYYEDCIITTSAKEDIVKTVNNYKSRETADYSSLRGEDLKKTKALNEEYGIYTGEWCEDISYVRYCYCDAYKEHYWEGRSDFVDFFSIKRDVRRFRLDFQNAKYSKAENGDVTLKFVYLYEDEVDENYTSRYTYTIKINKNGYVKTYSLNKFTESVDYSVEGNPYKTTDESVDKYTFVYNKVKVKSLELSTEKIVLGKDGEYDLIVTMNPDNATYKSVYVNDENMDTLVANCSSYDEEGVINVWANGPGTTTFEVCAYGGDVSKTVEVVVEYSLADRIVEFFEEIYYNIRWFFFDLFFGENFEEDYIVDEETAYYDDITTVG